MRIPRTLILAAVVLAGGSARAVTGDLNRDGVVNYDDFFILAENFGKRGTPVPETQIISTTIHDTVYVSLDDRLRTEVHERSDRYGWNTPWGRVNTSSKWRFLAYRVTSTGIAVSGTFIITFQNTTDADLLAMYHPTFFDRDDFKIAEYVKFLTVRIGANSERTETQPFEIELSRLAVANTIETMGISTSAWERTDD